MPKSSSSTAAAGAGASGASQEEEFEDADPISHRSLATVQVIESVAPIQGADLIEVVGVLGWKLVCPKGQSKPNDLCVFFEIDSNVPRLPAFVQLEKAEYKVKTRTFRGQVSQGFCAPISILDDTEVQAYADPSYPAFDPQTTKPAPVVGTDCTKWLRVHKISDVYFFQRFGTMDRSTLLGKEARLPFPSLFPRTDEERVQGIPHMLQSALGMHVYITEKLDGSSATIFCKNGEFGVCSRNYQVLPPEETGCESSLWDFVRANELQQKMFALGRNIAVQGEMVGPGLQSNKLKLARRRMYVFRAYDIDSQRFLSLAELQQVSSDLQLPLVPVIEADIALHHTVDDLVAMANAPTQIVPETPAKAPKGLREGLVIVFHDGDAAPIRSFKVISPQFLLKHD